MVRFVVIIPVFIGSCFSNNVRSRWKHALLLDCSLTASHPDAQSVNYSVWSKATSADVKLSSPLVVCFLASMQVLCGIAAERTSRDKRFFGYHGWGHVEITQLRVCPVPLRAAFRDTTIG